MYPRQKCKSYDFFKSMPHMGNQYCAYVVRFVQSILLPPKSFLFHIQKINIYNTERNRPFQTSTLLSNIAFACVQMEMMAQSSLSFKNQVILGKNAKVENSGDVRTKLEKAVLESVVSPLQYSADQFSVKMLLFSFEVMVSIFRLKSL